MKDIFLAGVDTLKVGYELSGSLSQEDKEALTEAKAKGQEKQFASAGTAIVFHGRSFRILPKGSRGYEWILQNDDVNIQLAGEFKDGVRFPEVMVTFRSAYLWREGWQLAEKKVRGWLDSFLTVVGEKVSRVDLMVDVKASMPHLDLVSGEIGGYCLRHDDHHVGGHAKGRSLTGYDFGSGDLLGRLYDKPKEARLKGKEWFFPMWSRNGWDGIAPVIRMEFEWHRDKLKEWQVNTVVDLANQMADLWKHCTRTWLLLREKVATDSNWRRWPLSQLWQLVQAAISEFGIVTGITRLQQVKPGYSRLLRGARGYLASAIAVAASGGLGQKHAWKAVKIWLFSELGSTEFSEYVEDKQVKFATM